ncbi:hypothetical protein JIN77_10015 [Verrucomicrobiaceae bacterium R5-34]|uniref:MerR family transcriptional regulator n=1 Tax=Oceaniferula flava TaxID=2800421 RepID=A0AAE2SDT7_9BACT|nr:hypothetical protein [Oceaniferula flavus]MBK1831061.1 hypothetical protein [Verrucomicrobiaceae bacterium R5-34]MBK1855577.1 hypothetical protein [Oceaniferula flavus]MBM1136883.1 hypothetical protein [Oceaniferula flavus]
MPDEPSPSKHHSPVDEVDAIYSVEIVAKLAGVDRQTVLHYHELGVVSPATEAMEFDSEGLRQLCRLEQLRQSHQLTDSGLQLIAGMLQEIEQLRLERRQRQRQYPGP